jgi:hypothetical protein
MATTEVQSTTDATDPTALYWDRDGLRVQLEAA